jgi:hypothetical protein
MHFLSFFYEKNRRKVPDTNDLRQKKSRQLVLGRFSSARHEKNFIFLVTEHQRFTTLKAN